MKRKKLNIICIIPARMASSRFPNKPMAKILNKPMILHVYQNIKDLILRKNMDMLLMVLVIM